MKKPIEYRLTPCGQDDGRKIRIQLAGFGNQRLISTDEILSAIEKLPRSHLTGLRGIAYDPLRLTLRGQPEQDWLAMLNAKGVYYQLERQILIHEFESKAMFQHILYHEIGHYVYYVIMDVALRRHWFYRLFPRSRHVSSYAARNPMEDFAECYAFYVTQPAKLQISGAKYHFFKHQVFKDHQPEPAAPTMR